MLVKKNHQFRSNTQLRTDRQLPIYLHRKLSLEKEIKILTRVVM